MLDGRIVDFAPYGAHIALCCMAHPNMRWSTKNIAPLGCRSLFYCGTMVDGKCDSTVPECQCSLDCLEPCSKEMGHPWDSSRPVK